MTMYRCKILSCRKLYYEAEFEIEADSKEEAVEEARELAENDNVDWSQLDAEDTEPLEIKALDSDAGGKFMSKQIMVRLVAYTRVEWTGVVEVPNDATKEEINDIVQVVELTVDRGDYMDDNEYWDQEEFWWEELDYEEEAPNFIAKYDEDKELKLKKVEDQ